MPNPYQTPEHVKRRHDGFSVAYRADRGNWMPWDETFQPDKKTGECQCSDCQSVRNSSADASGEVAI